MAQSYTITANNNAEIFYSVGQKDGADTYSIDFSPWVEDNHDISTVTWTSKVGQATISGEALASNVASALITFSQAGSNLIQVKAATASNEIYIAYLNIVVKDPTIVIDADYDYSIWTSNP